MVRAWAILMALTCAAAFVPDASAWYAPGTLLDEMDDHDHEHADEPLAGEYVLGPSAPPGATGPGKWGPAAFGTGATITYSFPDANGYATGGTSEFNATAIVPLESFMPFTLAQIKEQVRLAMDAWEAVANVTFIEVTDTDVSFNGVGAAGDIRIGGHTFNGPGGTLAHCYFPPVLVVPGYTLEGDLHFDVAETWKIGYGGTGFDIFQVTAHELGHALGLNHTAVANSLMRSTYSEAFRGPQPDDIAGAQFIYGAPLPEPASASVIAIGALALLRRPRSMRSPPMHRSSDAAAGFNRPNSTTLPL
jgi:hypothetical protein